MHPRGPTFPSCPESTSSPAQHARHGAGEALSAKETLQPLQRRHAGMHLRATAERRRGAEGLLHCMPPRNPCRDNCSDGTPGDAGCWKHSFPAGLQATFSPPACLGSPWLLFAPQSSQDTFLPAPPPLPPQQPRGTLRLQQGEVQKEAAGAKTRGTRRKQKGKERKKRKERQAESAPRGSCVQPGAFAARSMGKKG